MMVKLIISDLDGTLLNKDHKIDEVIQSSISLIEKKGICFAVATGRNMYENEFIFKDISKYYTLCMNGAIIKDNSNLIYYKKSINKQIIFDLLNNFNNRKFTFEFSGINKSYTNLSFDEYIYNLKTFDDKKIYDFNKIKKNIIFYVDNDLIMQREIFKINVRISDTYAKMLFNKYLKEKSDFIVNSPSLSKVYEITEKNVNKGKSAEILCDILNIDKEDTFVYGNGYNDIELIKLFNNSFAPNNAVEEVKKEAKEILEDYEKYSVATHIKKIVKGV